MLFYYQILISFLIALTTIGEIIAKITAKIIPPTNLREANIAMKFATALPRVTQLLKYIAAIFNEERIIAEINNTTKRIIGLSFFLNALYNKATTRV